MTLRADVHHPGKDGAVVPRLCEACEARHRGICGALTTDELVGLSKHSGKKVLGSGEVFVDDASEVLGYANIMGGVAKLTKTLPDGRQQIVGLQFAPDFLGRPFEERSRVTIETATKLQLCTFPKSMLDRLVAENPDLKQRLLDQSLRQLDEAREWMVTLGRKSAREKVAAFIAYIAEHSAPVQKAGSAQPVQAVMVELPLSRADMADFLGLTIETVSRQITALKKSGLIDLVDARHISVPSLRRLRVEAGG
jgi:CRP/FNR family transcriptional regulator, anaerobic regulatory protein